ncbi:hypothetical protein BROUX41_006087 [Berkeleyomyces rouxiae]|uniref:uncharacterized protein n=1 Tax=Berkeleyomyces rouxiae TaxID=2035830 RepID=UPI003B7DB1A3
MPLQWYSLGDILSNLKLQGTLLHATGIIVKYDGNRQTRQDWRAIVTIRDRAGDEVEFTLFHGNESAMPQKEYVGYGVILACAKVQTRLNQCLVSTSKTEICFFAPGQIKSLSLSSRPEFFLRKGSGMTFINQHLIDHLKADYKEMDRSSVPEATSTVQAISRNAMYGGKKFKLIQELSSGIWCNLLVQLVRPPQKMDRRTSLWVADYTTNSMVGYYTRGGSHGDELNYLGGMGGTGEGESTANASGLPSDMLLEVSLFGRHQDEFWELSPTEGQWFDLRNVRVEDKSYGLEGGIHETSNFVADVCVKRVNDKAEFADKTSALYAACQRRQKFLKGQTPSATQEGSLFKDKTVVYPTTKRPASPSASETNGSGTDSAAPRPGKQKKNGRERRKAAEAAIQAQMELESQAKIPSDLSPLVSCESHTAYISSVHEMLQKVSYGVIVDGETINISCPFNLAKYLAVVRIVDFQPHDVRDFTQSRILFKDGQPVNNSDDEESDDEEGDSKIPFNPALMKESWEWAFRLKLQDARVMPANHVPSFVWVNVNNDSAEYLLGMDATNLHKDDDALAKLKNKMFHLWDKLEEIKRAEAALQEANRRKQKRRNEGMPLDSPDSDRQATIGKGAKPSRADLKPAPFKCCIQQYGAVVPTRNPWDANAGDGKKYSREYLLFGTRLRDE